MRTTPTLFIVGLACMALAYLSFYAMTYEGYTSGLIGLIFFGGLGFGLLMLALGETIEERKRL